MKPKKWPIGVGPILATGLKCQQISPEMVLLTNCPTINKSHSSIEYSLHFSGGNGL